MNNKWLGKHQMSNINKNSRKDYKNYIKKQFKYKYYTVSLVQTILKLFKTFSAHHKPLQRSNGFKLPWAFAMQWKTTLTNSLHVNGWN